MWILDRANRAAKPRVWVTVGVVVAGTLLAALVSWAYDTMQEPSEPTGYTDDSEYASTTTEDLWRDRIVALGNHPDIGHLTDSDIANWGDAVCDDMLLYQSVDTLTAVLYQSMPGGATGGSPEGLAVLENNLLITIDLYCPEYNGY